MRTRPHYGCFMLFRMLLAIPKRKNMREKYSNVLRWMGLVVFAICQHFNVANCPLDFGQSDRRVSLTRTEQRLSGAFTSLNENINQPVKAVSAAGSIGLQTADAWNALTAWWGLSARCRSACLWNPGLETWHPRGGDVQPEVGFVLFTSFMCSLLIFLFFLKIDSWALILWWYGMTSFVGIPWTCLRSCRKKKHAQLTTFSSLRLSRMLASHSLNSPKRQDLDQQRFHCSPEFSVS